MQKISLVGSKVFIERMIKMEWWWIVMEQHGHAGED
jgi:hypothetical protein